MQVILTEKIRNLGVLGDCVSVKPGYARNYLLPKGKALIASKQNLEAFEARRSELEKQEANRFAKAQELAQKLEDQKVHIQTRAGEGGKLFGSVNNRDVVDYLQQQGFAVSRHQVRLNESTIRHTGEYQVTIQLHTDIEVELPLNVVAQDQA